MTRPFKCWAAGAASSYLVVLEQVPPLGDPRTCTDCNTFCDLRGKSPSGPSGTAAVFLYERLDLKTFLKTYLNMYRSIFFSFENLKNVHRSHFSINVFEKWDRYRLGGKVGINMTFPKRCPVYFGEAAIGKGWQRFAAENFDHDLEIFILQNLLHQHLISGNLLIYGRKKSTEQYFYTNGAIIGLHLNPSPLAPRKYLRGAWNRGVIKYIFRLEKWKHRWTFFKMWVKIRKDLGGPFLEIVGAVFGKPKANGKGALNPEYEPLAPNRLRDRAVLPDHFLVED